MEDHSIIEEKSCFDIIIMNISIHKKKHIEVAKNVYHWLNKCLFLNINVDNTPVKMMKTLNNFLKEEVT